MTHPQILEKAIQKAIDGGWRYDLGNGWASFGDHDFRAPVVNNDGDIEQYDGDGHWITLPKESFIFNHEFAKALWGDNVYYTTYQNTWGGRTTKDDPNAIKGHANGLPKWQYRLQQMVIADDPVAYLGEHI